MGTGQMASHKHLFVGSENRSALIPQFQLFATAGSDGFLGTIQRGGRPTTTPMSVIAILRPTTGESPISGCPSYVRILLIFRDQLWHPRS